MGLLGARGVSELLLRVGEFGLDPGCARGRGGSFLRGCGGRWWWSGLHDTVGQHGVEGDGNGVVRVCSKMAVGSHGGVSPPVHRDWLGTQGWSPYSGGTGPTSIAHAGLGVKGGPFYSSYRGWYSVVWAVSEVLDMDVGAAAPNGGSHGWLSGGHHVDGGASHLGRVGDERGCGWWLGRFLHWMPPRSGSGVWARLVCPRASVTWVGCRAKAPRFCAGDDDACGRRFLPEDVAVDLLSASEFRVKTLARWG